MLTARLLLALCRRASPCPALSWGGCACRGIEPRLEPFTLRAVSAHASPCPAGLCHASPCPAASVGSWESNPSGDRHPYRTERFPCHALSGLASACPATPGLTPKRGLSGVEPERRPSALPHPKMPLPRHAAPRHAKPRIARPRARPQSESNRLFNHSGYQPLERPHAMPRRALPRRA